MVKEDMGDKVKSLVLLLAIVSSAYAAREPPYGTTANGGFDINSISSFLDDFDGTSSKIEFPFPTGKGENYNYGFPPSGSPSSYGYKSQLPQYDSPVIPTAVAPIYSLKPAPLPTQPPTLSTVPSYTPSYTYPTPTTKSYNYNDFSPKETTPRYEQYAQASAQVSDNHGSYRPPNKNYILGDPSLKSANVQSHLTVSANNPVFPTSHGSYRPPNKNYVLGDPNKSSSQSPASFFPQKPSNFGSSQISNFAVNSPQTNPPSGFGTFQTQNIVSSTPSYDNKVVFGSQTTGFSNQQASYTNNPSNSFANSPSVSFPSHSFTSPGSYNNQAVNSYGQTIGHTQSNNHAVNSYGQPVNNFKTPSYSPSGFGSTGFGQGLNQQQFGQVNFGGQGSKYLPQGNPVGVPQNQYQFGGHPNKYGNPNFGGFGTNYLIPSGSYGNQPGKYASPPLKYPIKQVGFGQPGASYNPTPSNNYASPGFGQYQGGYKGNYNLKGEGAYTKGAYSSGKYRRVPGQYPPPGQYPTPGQYPAPGQYSTSGQYPTSGQYSAPYRGHSPAQGSYHKKPPPSYSASSPFSIFEDMVLL